MKKFLSLSFSLLAAGIFLPSSPAEEAKPSPVPAQEKAPVPSPASRANSSPSAVEPASSLLKNGSMEADADGDGWPDAWPKNKDATFVVDDGNHFIRLTSPEPGATVMLYQRLPIPAGTEALEMTWRQRVPALKPGKQPWFDARIMIEFLNAAAEKIPGAPSAPYARSASNDWTWKSIRFLVPKDAAFLALMPALFQVETGVFDLDDFAVKKVEAGPLREMAAAAESEKAQKVAATAADKQGKAAAALEANGSLVTNGNFEKEGKEAWPSDWGRLKTGGSWENEEGNHFLRMTSPAPGQMVMMYRTFDIPAGTKALAMTWRQRVTGLKKGAMPWFDARIMLEFMDASGKKMAKNPGAPYAQGDTKGWVDKSTEFLVPEGAVTLVMMPTLFQVAAGTFDLDDIALKPTDPAALMAKTKEAEEVAKASFVPSEEPRKDKWPKELHVKGNRLVDPDGTEVWLQGVNVGGLESVPHDTQCIKSTVVAIDEWKANCLRVPIKDEFWFGKSPYQKDGGKAYRETLDKIVVLAANRGAYVVVDLHRFRAPKQEHADFWKDAAEHYKNHPAVLFDLFNEPHGISWPIWRDGGFVSEKKEGVDESAFLTPEEKLKNSGFQSVGMQALADTVRSTGAKNIIVAGGLFWCNDLTGINDGYALNDKGGNGIMYSWHTYNWHTGWAKVLPVAEKYPIFLGEVGADANKMSFIPAERQEDPRTWVPDMLGFIQKYRINWTGWCFHPRSAPVLISDWKYTPTPHWGQPAKDALSGKKFELTKMR